jgi:hypothetical protein
MLVKLIDGSYRVGATTNVFGFSEVAEEHALNMVKTGKIDKNANIWGLTYA